MPARQSPLLVSTLIAVGCGSAPPFPLLQGEAPPAPDTASASPAADPAPLSEMPLPASRTLWAWDVVGEATVTDPGGMDASWNGRVTWTWKNETTGDPACTATLDTTGRGQDDDCRPEDGCVFGIPVEHTLLTLDGPDDCARVLGLPDTDGPLDRWGIGYADTFDNGDAQADHAVLYWWSRDSKTFPATWLPMGTATWDDATGTFSYTLDTLWFFVVDE